MTPCLDRYRLSMEADAAGSGDRRRSSSSREACAHVASRPSDTGSCTPIGYPVTRFRVAQPIGARIRVPRQRSGSRCRSAGPSSRVQLPARRSTGRLCRPLDVARSEQDALRGECTQPLVRSGRGGRPDPLPVPSTRCGDRTRSARRAQGPPVGSGPWSPSSQHTSDIMTGPRPWTQTSAPLAGRSALSSSPPGETSRSAGRCWTCSMPPEAAGEQRTRPAPRREDDDYCPP